jgi:hypothetical protein
VILAEVLTPGGFGRAVAAPLDDDRLWRRSASGVLAVHVHNRPDASFD